MKLNTREITMVKKVVTGFFTVMGVIFCMVIIFSKVAGKHHWNKDTGVDTHQQFTVAYVDFGINDMRKINIVSWRDFDDSDQLQFTDTDGRTYLTGCGRVILVEEPQK